ncbi:MAG TPA: hypothetical protein VF846_15810 [Thermoanaerobaculia bacterium]|jgi:hypothetical protein
MKRFVPLLAIVAIALSFAPPAAADHCARCLIVQPNGVCAYDRPNGFEFCNMIGDVCQTSGARCTHTSLSASLASEYVVASVERLDEPQQAPKNDTLVASAATAPATR